MTGDELTFEQAEAELRRIVERLESGEAGIDEALALWERGEALYAICRERLDAAEGKVEELTERVQAARPSSA
jgi:exodeoxyribonuclease VII small subunit